jgi:hypothetical protein
LEKLKRKKDIMLPLVAAVAIYSGIKYIKDNAFAEKFDEESKCRNEQAAYYPDDANTERLKDGVGDIFISVDE